MNVLVDLERCEGHGLCVFAAPEVFDLDDDGTLHYDPSPPEALRAAVEDAVRSCPVAAIRIEANPLAGLPSRGSSAATSPPTTSVIESPSGRLR